MASVKGQESGLHYGSATTDQTALRRRVIQQLEERIAGDESLLALLSTSRSRAGARMTFLLERRLEQSRRDLKGLRSDGHKEREGALKLAGSRSWATPIQTSV